MKHVSYRTGTEERRFATELPTSVLELAPREGEVASIVYELGGCTAKEVEARLSKRLTNATVRSMLRRLERKGLVVRRAKGTYRTFVYLPALTNDYVRERALVRFAQEHFDGSLPALAATLVHLMDLQLPTPTKSKGGPVVSRAAELLARAG
jgi:BlaI family penicillinase repressor